MIITEIYHDIHVGCLPYLNFIIQNEVVDKSILERKY